MTDNENNIQIILFVIQEAIKTLQSFLDPTFDKDTVSIDPDDFLNCAEYAAKLILTQCYCDRYHGYDCGCTISTINSENAIKAVDQLKKSWQ